MKGAKKMNQRILLKATAVRIEYHWFFIMRYRKKGNALNAAGEPFTSEKLIHLSDAIGKHGMKARHLERRYEQMSGLYS
jgi:hypothetical protein